jgi:anthranilate phosphoribosyltransferase
VVALNAALALEVAGKISTEDHPRGIELARDILASGAAWSKLEQLAAFLQK